MTRTIRLPRRLSDEYANSLHQTYVDEGDFNEEYFISGEDVDVLKPDGTPLLMFRHKAIPEDIDVYLDIREAAALSQNRISAGGDERSHSGIMGYADASRGIIGDRDAIVPYCRTTAYTGKDVSRWVRVLPFIRAVDKVFQDTCPERYKVQRDMVRRTTPDFTIKNTAFTTVTVNKTWRTKVHKDDGDLPEGFGVMSVIEAGKYEGCYLVFPQFRVAVDMRNRDVVLADVHEWHGNTPFLNVEKYDDPAEYPFERISTVFYYRSEMINCGTAKEERERRDNWS